MFSEKYLQWKFKTSDSDIFRGNESTWDSKKNPNISCASCEHLDGKISTPMNGDWWENLFLLIELKNEGHFMHN